MPLSDWRARTPAEIQDAIRAAKATPAQRDVLRRWVDETVADAASVDVARLLSRIGRPISVELDFRDLETLFYTAHGYDLKETAAALHLAPGSVYSRRRKLCRKLGARNVTHAVALWLMRED